MVKKSIIIKRIDLSDLHNHWQAINEAVSMYNIEGAKTQDLNGFEVVNNRTNWTLTWLG